MNPHYALVALRAGHRCEYCHAPEVVFNFPFEVEHIIPTALAGADSETNWALACRSCNLWKAIHVTSRDPDSGIEVGLFHPRADRWEDHFSVDPEQGIIDGQTPSGRATVMRLRMNDPAQQRARQQWMRLGLFP
jgi:hypothetical protein